MDQARVRQEWLARPSAVERVKHDRGRAPTRHRVNGAVQNGRSISNAEPSSEHREYGLEASV